MAYSLSSPLVGPSVGSPIAVLSWLVRHQYSAKRPSAVADYLDEIYRLGALTGLCADLLVAQSAHETANWTSHWWAERLNPAGIGITGDPAQNEASHTWANGTDAARAQVVHMWAYTVSSSKPALEPYIDLDPRWDAVFDAGFAGTVHVLGDLGNGRWATDPQYAQQIAAKANAIFGGAEPMTTYQIVGLPGPGIELPVPLAHDIIPLTQPNQRPGITRQKPGYWVQHETANYAASANAAMHNTWLHNGAGGAQVSFHFVVDDGIIYQMIPIDEVTWQAADGGGPGNMSGISCELCVNAGIDTAKARHNAEALAGGICKAMGLPADRVKRHWDFNFNDPERHHCPDTMMTEGYWSTFIANVATIIAPEPTLPVYATPEIPDWFARSVTQDAPSDAMVDGVRWWVMRRNVEALKPVQRYSRPDTHSPKTGPRINTRDRVRIERTFDLTDAVTGKRRQWLVATDGSYLTAASFSPRITIRSR